MSQQATKDALSDEINKDISLDELTEAVKNSKKGKSVSEDLIPNEFLKASNQLMLKTVLNLYNQCFKLGV